MYEMAVRPPRAGSLKEQIFLTVWLRRQEIEALKVMALVTAIANQGADDKEPSKKAINEYLMALLPFVGKDKTVGQKQMIERLEKEAQGMVTFKPMDLLVRRKH